MEFFGWSLWEETLALTQSIKVNTGNRTSNLNCLKGYCPSLFQDNPCLNKKILSFVQIKLKDKIKKHLPKKEIVQRLVQTDLRRNSNYSMCVGCHDLTFKARLWFSRLEKQERARGLGKSVCLGKRQRHEKGSVCDMKEEST